MMQLMHGNAPLLYLSKEKHNSIYMMINLDDVSYSYSKHKDMVIKRNALLPFEVRLKRNRTK